jgi:aspartate kinase
MIIKKFGGTSVGSAQRIKNVAKLVTSEKQTTLVVLSAMAGTTNTLVEICNYLANNNIESATDCINNLESEYKKVVSELFSKPEYIKKGDDLIKSHFDYIRSFTLSVFTQKEEKAILAQGELISSSLMHLYLCEQGIENALLHALNFMRINEDLEPNYSFIIENLKHEIEKNKANLYITQGFICRNAFGEIDNLQRGGSDYSASIIGAAINAEEIQIWTDIDGIHNNDPRYIKNTKPLDYLSFDEAAELAYFGAKILHPSSITPAKISNIPVRLKNTMQPEAKGTLISNITIQKGIKAIAAKDNITVVKIKSGRMLLAYGFLRRVFEVFETYKTSIDMITTSEVAISLTIDNTTYLNNIIEDLRKFGHVEVDSEMSIVCIVGDFITDSKGYGSKIFNALKDIPIRMISYGGSKHNISILIKTEDKIKTLQALNSELF